MSCPAPVAEDKLQSTVSNHQLTDSLKTQLSPIARQIIANRDLFLGTVIVVDKPDMPLFYYVPLLVKKPFDLVVIPLLRMEHIEKHRPKKSSWAKAARDDVEFAWEVQLEAIQVEDPCVDCSTDEVLIVFKVFFANHNTLLSYQSPTSLEMALDAAPKPEAASCNEVAAEPGAKPRSYSDQVA